MVKNSRTDKPSSPTGTTLSSSILYELGEDRSTHLEGPLKALYEDPTVHRTETSNVCGLENRYRYRGAYCRVRVGILCIISRRARVVQVGGVFSVALSMIMDHVA
jgi:hypothetical protein